MVEAEVAVGLEAEVEEVDLEEVGAVGLEVVVVVVVVLEVVGRCTYPASACLMMVTLTVTGVES